MGLIFTSPVLLMEMGTIPDESPSLEIINLPGEGGLSSHPQIEVPTNTING